MKTFRPVLVLLLPLFLHQPASAVYSQKRPVLIRDRADLRVSPTRSFRQDSIPSRSVKRYDRISSWSDFNSVAIRPLTARFDSSKDYQQVLEDREKKRHEDKCRALLESNQAITRQVRQIDSLVRVQAFGVLAEGHRRQQFPVIDSLLIRSNRLEYIRISLFLRSLPECPMPVFKLENYPTLSRLETEGRVVIIGGVMTLAAMRLPPLPPTTNNPRQDATVYLAKIKDLLGLYYAQLRTTFPQYQAYETRQKLATDPARASFRRNFCYSILCEIQ